MPIGTNLCIYDQLHNVNLSNMIKISLNQFKMLTTAHYDLLQHTVTYHHIPWSCTAYKCLLYLITADYSILEPNSTYYSQLPSNTTLAFLVPSLFPLGPLNTMLTYSDTHWHPLHPHLYIYCLTSIIRLVWSICFSNI